MINRIIDLNIEAGGGGTGGWVGADSRELFSEVCLAHVLVMDII